LWRTSPCLVAIVQPVWQPGHRDSAPSSPETRHRMVRTVRGSAPRSVVQNGIDTSRNGTRKRVDGPRCSRRYSLAPRPQSVSPSGRAARRRIPRSWASARVPDQTGIGMSDRNSAVADLIPDVAPLWSARTLWEKDRPLRRSAVAGRGTSPQAGRAPKLRRLHPGVASQWRLIAVVTPETAVDQVSAERPTRQNHALQQRQPPSGIDLDDRGSLRNSRKVTADRPIIRPLRCPD
jgi:hypothetical protein